MLFHVLRSFVWVDLVEWTIGTELWSRSLAACAGFALVHDRGVLAVHSFRLVGLQVT